MDADEHPPQRLEQSELATADPIESAALEIRRHASSALLGFTYAVGRIVLDRFFAGDVGAWRHKGPKDASLRRLAACLSDIGCLSASSLYRCVAIHLVLRRLGGISQWQNLTPSHVRAVLPLADSDQELVLREADDGNWSVRQVEERVRTAPVTKRGRPRKPAFLRALGQIETLLRADGQAFMELDRAGGLGMEQIELVHARIVRAEERLHRLRDEFNPKRVKARQDRASGDRKATRTA